jgi:4-amino-4-deoxy-L-arabinose transferase-like glycosyltransferase
LKEDQSHGVMRHRILLAVSAVYLVVADLIWFARDTRPPFWDMACHESLALQVLDTFSMFGLVGVLRMLPGITGYYPPFYHSVVALFFDLFGKSVVVARWANLPAIILLLLATYGIGRTVLSRTSAAAAAVLANFYPLMLWLSRETMIEYWLTSLVAVAMWLLVTTEFKDRKWAILIGIVCGLGMLTKWTFGFFIAVPFLWIARKNLKNAALSVSVGAAISLYWYIPEISELRRFLQINNAGAVGKGDPNRLSFQSLVFYLRALEGYQVFFVLFLLFIAGAVILRKRFHSGWTPILLWLVCGWLSLMIFQNKDPRYSVPLLPAVALISANVFERSRAALALTLPFLAFQHYLVSFGIPKLPEKIVLMDGVHGVLSYDWNLYTQDYFGLWGRPAREDWKIQHVLDAIASPGGRQLRLGIVPNIARFDPVAFEFYIALQNRRVTINRLWHFDARAVSNNDFILVSETAESSAVLDEVLNPERGSITEYVLKRPDTFQIVERFALPNGVMIRLYKVAL